MNLLLTLRGNSMKYMLHNLFSCLAEKTQVDKPKLKPPLIEIAPLELNYNLYKKAMDDLFDVLSQHQVGEIHISYSGEGLKTPLESTIENPYHGIPVDSKNEEK